MLPRPEEGVRGSQRIRLAQRWSFVAIYVALASWLVYRVVQFHDPRTGFTPLIRFGETFAPTRLTALDGVQFHTYRSMGYDGQFYAQIAVAGNPFAPGLRKALDSPAYRAKRVLLPLLAHLVGLGRPAWVLGAYALSNLVCWLVLAWILARWWFPPTGVHNLLRWVGVMFGAGMLVSTARSLTDGPALLVIAAGLRALELGRHWLAASILGVAGLVRETSIVVASAFVPPTGPGPRAWRRGLLAALLCAMPAVAWGTVLLMHYGKVYEGAFDMPIVVLMKEIGRIPFLLQTSGSLPSRKELFVLLSTLVQVGFLFGRPLPALPWWRVGSMFAGLAFFLPSVVWMDSLNTVPRILIPLTLAFNVLAPRTRGGLVLLLAGNLTVIFATDVLFVPFKA